MTHIKEPLDALALASTEAERFRIQAGVRLRWLREAYEKKEPGQHSQLKWATVSELSKVTLNRIELGRNQAPIEVIARLIYSTWASANYWLFGVIGDGYMPAWLEESLMADHGFHLRSFEDFVRERSRVSFELRPPTAAQKKEAKKRQRARQKSA